MLPPFIIEQIRKREERQKTEQRPVLELPIGPFPRRRGPSVSPPEEEAPQRGVIIVDL
jgi:hypothetical protein